MHLIDADVFNSQLVKLKNTTDFHLTWSKTLTSNRG